MRDDGQGTLQPAEEGRQRRETHGISDAWPGACLGHPPSPYAVSTLQPIVNWRVAPLPPDSAIDLLCNQAVGDEVLEDVNYVLA